MVVFDGLVLRCRHGQLRSLDSCQATFRTLLKRTGPSQDAMSNTVLLWRFGGSGASMRSTSSSLEVDDDGDGGGGVAGGDGTRARRGTGRWAPGGGAGRATHGLGPSHARYSDSIARRSGPDCTVPETSHPYIAAIPMEIMNFDSF